LALYKILTNHGIARNPGMLPQSPSTARRNQIVPNIKDHHENLYKLKMFKFPMQPQREEREAQGARIKAQG